jgi:phosphodiesterase/alkaline phosphatase D-like protein
MRSADRTLAIGAEFVCTSISAGGPGGEDWFTEFLPDNPHVHFYNPNPGGFTMVKVSPES